MPFWNLIIENNQLGGDKLYLGPSPDCSQVNMRMSIRDFDKLPGEAAPGQSADKTNEYFLSIFQAVFPSAYLPID